MHHLILLVVLLPTEAEESITDESFTQHDQGTRYKSILPRVNWRIVHSKAFVAYTGGGAFHSAAYFTLVYLMSSYARSLGYSNTSGAQIIALSNACNFGGKIITGYLADRLGRLNAPVLSTFVSAAVTFGL